MRFSVCGILLVGSLKAGVKLSYVMSPIMNENGNEEKVSETVYLPIDTLRYIEGRLLTTIELLGLEEQREKSLKDTVRQNIWRDGEVEMFLTFSGKEIHRFVEAEYKTCSRCGVKGDNVVSVKLTKKGDKEDICFDCQTKHTEKG